jgi:hypothetical protein
MPPDFGKGASAKPYLPAWCQGIVPERRKRNRFFHIFNPDLLIVDR